MSNSAAPSFFLTPSPEPSTTTRWPRRLSSAESRETYSLTGVRVARLCGVTCAIERLAAGTGIGPRLTSGLSRGLRRSRHRALAACVGGDELLGLLARLVVGALAVRGLHQVAGG